MMPDLRVALLLLAASACTARVSSRSGGEPIPAGGTPAVPSGGSGGTPGTAATGGVPGSRLACRTSRAPSGWIIVDYVVNPECQTAGRERYNGAVQVRHAGYAAGTVLVVCADQPIPPGWLRQPGAEGAREDQCPSSANPRPLAERVVTIRRQ